MKANIENKKIGTILTMKDGSQCKCIDYRSYRDCDFQFLDEYGAIKTNLSYGNFVKGSIKNPYAPHVANVGFVGVGEDNNTKPEAYKIWSNMLMRCYKTRKDRRRDINYLNCEICEDWLCFQNFVKWYDDNLCLISKDIKEKICIDKDLLFKNNKFYSPDTCVPIPEKINIFLTTSKYARGGFPIGVYYENSTNKYKVQCCDPLNRYSRNIGRFNNYIDAFLKYKETKEKYAKDLADYYDGLIDKRAIDALRNYIIDIED